MLLYYFFVFLTTLSHTYFSPESLEYKR